MPTVILANKLNEVVAKLMTPAEINGAQPPYLAITIDGSIGRDTLLYGLDYGCSIVDVADQARVIIVAMIVRNYKPNPVIHIGFEANIYEVPRSYAYHREVSETPFDRAEVWASRPRVLQAGSDYTIALKVTGRSPLVNDVGPYLIAHGEFGAGKGRAPRLKEISS